MLGRGQGEPCVCGGRGSLTHYPKENTDDSHCLAAPSPHHLLGPHQHPDLIWSRPEKVSCVPGLDPPLPMRAQDQRGGVTPQGSHS